VREVEEWFAGGGLEACGADAVAVGGASLTQGPQSILEESLGSRST
jgi:hypothetical protein